MSFSVKNLRNRPVQVALRDPITLQVITDPDTNTAVELQIAGPDSKSFATAVQTCQFKVANEMKGKTATDSLDPEIHNQLTFELFASLVTGWNETAGNYFKEELEGDPTFTKAKFAKLVNSDEYYWIVKQIEVAVADRQRFFPKQLS
jgi:hypothetical protein